MSLNLKIVSVSWNDDNERLNSKGCAPVQCDAKAILIMMQLHVAIFWKRFVSEQITKKGNGLQGYRMNSQALWKREIDPQKTLVILLKTDIIIDHRDLCPINSCSVCIE